MEIPWFSRPYEILSSKICGKSSDFNFFGILSIIFHFLVKARTITDNYHSTVLTTLREKYVKSVYGKLSKDVAYFQNNAPTHKSHIAMKTIRDSGVRITRTTLLFARSGSVLRSKEEKVWKIVNFLPAKMKKLWRPVCRARQHFFKGQTALQVRYSKEDGVWNIK